MSSAEGSFHESVVKSIKSSTKSISSDIEGDKSVAPSEKTSALPHTKRHPALVVRSNRDLTTARSPASALVSAATSRSLDVAARNHNTNLFFKPLRRLGSSLFGGLSLKSENGDRAENDARPPGACKDSKLLVSASVASTAGALLDDMSPASSSNARKGPMPPARKVSTSSLFGAVMKTSQAVRDMRPAEPSTPPREVRHPPPEPHQCNMTMSPSGNTVMSILNRCTMNSPFRFNSPKTKRHGTTTCTSTYSASSTSAPSNKRRKLLRSHETPEKSADDYDNMQEASVINGEVRYIDWSIRSSLRIECQKSNFLKRHTSNMKWREKLQYWQYPDDSACFGSARRMATHVPQNQKLGKRRAGHNGSTPELSRIGRSSSLPLPPIGLESKLSQPERDLPKDCQRLSSKTMKESRSRTYSAEEGILWQQALSSLYKKWCLKIEEIGSSEDMYDCYFYSVGEDHVVLFRADFTQQSIEHRVIVSSSSENFRLKLLAVGVSQVAEIDPDDPPTQQIDYARNHPTTPISPNVEADLEALRRAKEYGQSAGADVFITFNKTGNQTLPRRQQTKQPFSVSGFDDVSAFFEVYLNCFGSISSKKEQCSLPTLLCGSIGPFLNASLKSPVVRLVKNSTVTELVGYLLPCTIRRMFGDLIGNMVRSLQNRRELHDPPLGGVVTDFGTGPNFLAVDFSHGSKLALASSMFNSSGGRTRAVANLVECRKGKSVQFLVWDAANESKVACMMTTPP